MRLGWHASHEQLAPSELLRLAAKAERAGFQAVMSSDHFAPWSARQGQSGHPWPWLGAAMGATRLPFLQLCTPVGWRYHPAVAAQAMATLAEMFPGRLTLALGSGENLNEHVAGERWPSKPERNARLLAAVGIIRALLAGETVSRDAPIRVDRAKLWTRPREPPAMVAAALSEATARWAGSWADGLVTIQRDDATLAALARAFREGGGAGKPLALQAHVAWAPTEREALAKAMDEWRTNAFPRAVTENLATTEEFDALAPLAREEDVRASVVLFHEPAALARRIEGWVRLGFTDVMLHHVGRDQDAFLDVAARELVPLVREG